MSYHLRHRLVTGVFDNPPPWLTHLEWPTGRDHQHMPSPAREITMREWWLKGFLGREQLLDESSESWFLDGHQTSLGSQSMVNDGWRIGPLWNCHVRIYQTFGLVVADQFHLDNTLHDREAQRFIPYEEGLSGMSGFRLRFFRIGCVHRMVFSGQDSMLYDYYTCALCGQTATTQYTD